MKHHASTTTANRTKRRSGFTIVELLIVIVVIAILAAITVVAYTGIQNRARNTALASSMTQIQRLIELYKAEHGMYPATGSATLVTGDSGPTVRTDSNCSAGTQQADWIPGITQTLPQSDPSHRGAVRNSTGEAQSGCYMYVSDGTNYILSAWNMRSSPSTEAGYRRLGFREIDNSQYYLCNHANIGGRASGSYVLAQDYYKYSYTLSSLTTCNETPPAGA
jgi:general secretion pathway protein G